MPWSVATINIHYAWLQAGALTDSLLPHEPEEAQAKRQKRDRQGAPAANTTPAPAVGKDRPAPPASSASLSAPVVLDPKLPDALMHVANSAEGDCDDPRCSLSDAAAAAAVAAAAASVAAAAAATVAAAAATAVLLLLLLQLLTTILRNSCARQR